jgi:hypothetical protein
MENPKHSTQLPELDPAQPPPRLPLCLPRMPGEGGGGTSWDRSARTSLSEPSCGGRPLPLHSNPNQFKRPIFYDDPEYATVRGTVGVSTFVAAVGTAGVKACEKRKSRCTRGRTPRARRKRVESSVLRGWETVALSQGRRDP